MESLLSILQRTTDYFRQRGVPQPKLDAELLIAHVLKCKRLELYLQHDRPLTDPFLDELRPLVKRRGQREPLQYILGHVDFAGILLKVDPRALIPRPETEQLVEHLLERAKTETPQRIIDLGTGSGAIGLALATGLPKAEVWLTDASRDALKLAYSNAQEQPCFSRIKFKHTSWLEGFGDETFDWIVSNPPYLTEAEMASAQPEVRNFEPHSALFAPEAGLADAITILQQAKQHLKPGGLVALETGIAHHAALTEEAQKLDYTQIESLSDYAGHPRFFLARHSVA